MEPNNTPKQPVRPVNPAGAGTPRPAARPVARPVAPRPVVSAPVAEPVEPVEPVEPKEPTFDNGPSVVGKKERKTGWVLALILLFIIAAGGVGFGVWAYLDGNMQRDQLNAQVNDLQQENAELQEQLASGGSTTGTGTGSGTEGEIVNTSDYIYVGEWGIKIKIPENIQVASYEISNWDSDNSAGTALCVSGSTSGHDGATPSFLSGTAENRYTDKLKVCLEKKHEGHKRGRRRFYV